MQDSIKKACTLFIISVSAHDFAYRAKFDSMQSLICYLLAHDVEARYSMGYKLIADFSFIFLKSSLFLLVLNNILNLSSVLAGV